MERGKLRVSKNILVPMLTILVSAFILAIYSYTKGEKLYLLVILPLVILLLLFLISWSFKRVEWDEKRIEVRGLFSKKEMNWDEVSQVQFFRAGFKKVLYMSGKERFLLIPLIFSGQRALGEALKRRLGDTNLGKSLPAQDFGTPLVEWVILWIAALALVIILILRIS